MLRCGAGSLEELSRRLDERAKGLMDRLICPVTGTTVAEAFHAEQRVLQPLPTMAEPFDVVVTPRVSRDCLVSFEGRRYGVPFAWVGRRTWMSGTLRHVVVRGAGEELARHTRATKARLLIDPEHYEGPSMEEVERPTPLGRRARLQLAGLSSASRHSLLMSAARRKVDLDAVAERCQSLTLVHAAELVEEASREDLSPVKFLDRMLEREIERKDERRIVTSLRLIGLPVGKTLEGFDWIFQPRADRSKLESLATRAFIREADNVLFMGPPGVVPRLRSRPLGLPQRNLHPLYYPLSRLLDELTLARGDGSYLRLSQRLVKT